MTIMPSTPVPNVALSCGVLAYCGQDTRWPLYATNVRLSMSYGAEALGAICDGIRFADVATVQDVGIARAVAELA